MSALAEALTHNRFAGDQIITLAKLVVQTAFQPIAEAATGTVFGYESLMRGFDRLGFASPLDLLDHAEKAGQLFAMEQMVQARAFAAFSALPDFQRRTLFLNFDARLVSVGAGVVDRLAQHLSRAGISPSSICFELSERFDTHAMPEFADLVSRMRLAGFKLAIDDFGAGQSGLMLLCDVPVDYVKIDRHFIHGIDLDQRKRHMVKYTVGIAHMLGSRVVAEGVETEAEFVTCRDLGCDLVQGWFVARPTVTHGELQASYPQLESSGKARRQLATLDAVLIRREIEAVPALKDTDDLDTVFALFRKTPERSFFPVVNANGEPRGVLNEHHVKELIYHPFGRDLLKNHVYQRSLSHFVTPAPIADVDTPAAEMMAIFAGMDGGNCVILTENMRYAGVLSAASLLKIINEKQLQIAQDQNPLTGLPGNRSIRDYVQDAMIDGEAARYFCYCDFDNFKPFNDRYGFHKGDMAISLFSALMSRHFVGENRFLGHVGGDDFFIGVTGLHRADLISVLSRLISDFSDGVRDLYSPEHQAAGCIIGHGRDGEERCFPLMRVSIAVLELPEGFASSDAVAVGARIADLKSLAKKSPDALAIDGFRDA